MGRSDFFWKLELLDLPKLEKKCKSVAWKNVIRWATNKYGLLWHFRIGKPLPTTIYFSGDYHQQLSYKDIWMSIKKWQLRKGLSLHEKYTYFVHTFIPYNIECFHGKPPMHSMKVHFKKTTSYMKNSTISFIYIINTCIYTFNDT